MASSKATTVNAYLKELPPDRRETISTVRDVVVQHLPKGYEESMVWGMITYGIPLATYPDTYNGSPLSYCGLAMQKRHNALYLMGLYSDTEQERQFRERWTADGHKLDMGKSCLRFTRVDALRLDIVEELVRSTSPDALIAQHERARAEAPSRPRRATR